MCSKQSYLRLNLHLILRGYNISKYIFDKIKMLTATYQSCKRTVRSSRYIVFDKKSIPMVACKVHSKIIDHNLVHISIKLKTTH